MLRSMTGYGSETFEDDGVIYTVEIHSVNKKNLDVSLYLPKDLLFLDIEIRKLLMQFASRGQLTLKLSKDINPSNVQGYLPDTQLFKSVYESWQHLAKISGFAQDQLSIEFIVEQIEKLSKSQKKDPESFKRKFFTAINKAGHSYLAMKYKEAAQLQKFLQGALDRIKEILDKVKLELSGLPQLQKAKFEELFKEFDLSAQDLQEKISREIVLFLDRYDVSEELQRLESHLQVFSETMQKKEESCGRNLEFLVQEMHREANTLGAKSQILAVTNLVLQIKSEIEKIREQVQNIE